MEIVKINTRSWHYRLWRFTYSLDKEDWELSQIRTSLCAYVHRIIWLTLPIALVVMVLSLVVAVCYVLIALWHLFWGSGYPGSLLAILRSPDDLVFVKRTDGFRIGRFRLFPYRLVLPGLGILVLVWGFQAHPAEMMAVMWVSMAAALVVGICWMIWKARDTGTYRLATAYLRAKKQKICPSVEFVRFSPPPPDEPGPIKNLRQSGFKFGDAAEGDPEDRSVI